MWEVKPFITVDPNSCSGLTVGSPGPECSRPDHVYVKVRSGVSVVTARPSEALNLTVPRLS